MCSAPCFLSAVNHHYVLVFPVILVPGSLSLKYIPFEELIVYSFPCSDESVILLLLPFYGAMHSLSIAQPTFAVMQS